MIQKITEIRAEPEIIKTGSVFKLRIKAIRYLTCAETKTKTCEEIKKFTCEEVNGN